MYSSLPRKVREFLSGLPTAWDDTKLLCGYPGADIVLARRKGDVWYIGGLNGTNENKTLSFSLVPLQVEGKTMDVFKDGVDDKSLPSKKTSSYQTIKWICHVFLVEDLWQ